eukprot:362866-Chlamydomonas_euryale.AAC.41
MEAIAGASAAASRDVRLSGPPCCVCMTVASSAPVTQLTSYTCPCRPRTLLLNSSFRSCGPM